jgi:hypothetical protein
LLNDEPRVAQLSDQSRSYAGRVHSREAVGRRLAEIYAKLD